MSTAGMILKVKAGKNTCEICYNPAYFSACIPCKSSDETPFELLGCGHGICKTCYQQICKRGPFTCPFCRNEGAQLVQFGGGIRNKINTFSEFLDEWQHNEHLLAMHQGIYMRMYRQIRINKKIYDLKKKEKIAEDKKKKEKEDKRLERELSRKKAVCKHCNKDTFTSLKQLELHISKKHA